MMTYWGGVITFFFFLSPAFFLIAVYSVVPNIAIFTVSGALLLASLALFYGGMSGDYGEYLVLALIFIGPIFSLKLLELVYLKRKPESQHVPWYYWLVIGQVVPIIWLLNLLR